MTICDDCNNSTSGRCWRHGVLFCTLGYDEISYADTDELGSERKEDEEKQNPEGDSDSDERGFS